MSDDTDERGGIGDPHCHTTASDGMVSPAGLVEAAIGAGLDLIAICDHDTMANAQEVRDRGGDAGLAVVMGQELTTKWPAQTHLLGWFLRRPVKSGMSLDDTVDAIHDQNGLAVLPHAFMPTYFASCQPAMLTRLIEHRELDGVELLFTAPTTGGRRRALHEFYAAHQDRLGAAIGASDSHFGRHDIGRVLTAFQGRTVEDFRRSVKARTTTPLAGSDQRVPVSQLAMQQWRSLVQLPIKRLRGDL